MSSVDLSRSAGAPLLFRGMAYAIPTMIALQFFLVGLAVFADGGAWELHRTNGGLIALPILIVFVMAFGVESLRSFRGAVGRIVALYVMQYVWLELGEMTGTGVVRALHALNAVFLTGAAVALAESVAWQGRR